MCKVITFKLKICTLKKTRKENTKVIIMLSWYGTLNNCPHHHTTLQRCPGPKCLEHVTATLLGNRDFADVIKDFEMRRLSWITWMGPTQSQGSL